MVMFLFRVFNVVIGKQSTRKHKKWEDDGILEVKGKHAILKVIHPSRLYIILDCQIDEQIIQFYIIHL